MITVTNEMTCGTLELVSGQYKVSGDFKVLPTGNVNNINVSVVKGGINVGVAYARKEGEELRYTYDRIGKEDMVSVMELMEVLVSELETKYKPVTK